MSKKNNIPSWDDTDMIEDIPSFEDTEDLTQKKKEEPAWSGVPDVLQPQEVTQPENYVEQQAELPKVAKNKAIPVAERYAQYKGEKLQKTFIRDSLYRESLLLYNLHHK